PRPPTPDTHPLSLPDALPILATGPNLDWQRTVGIVGARNASAAGVKMTRLLAGDLGERGYTVVSGLARGIDAAAHRASLATGTIDRKSTRLNSSHVKISYAVF